VDKGDSQALTARARGVTPGRPVALSFVLNDMNAAYDRYVIEQYLQTLRKIDPDLSIVFTNPNGTFAASTDGSRVEAVLNNDHFGAEFLAAVQQGDLAKLRELVLASNRSISDKASNADALRIMNEDGIKSLIAINDQMRPVGVVRRDRIIAQLVGGMV
jgi:CBS domain-containing protein